MLVLLLCLCSVCFAVSEQSQDEAVKVVLDILKSGDPDMQTVAITMVREMPGRKVTEALVKELPNLPITGQVQLLSVLSDRGDNTALPAVISAIKAKDISVRIAALKALGQLGDASSITLLVETAADSKGDEQKAARESLYRLRGPDVDKAIIAKLLTAESAEKNKKLKISTGSAVKVELIRCIEKRNIEAGVETLLKTAQDSDHKVQRESFKALKIIADERYLSALLLLSINVEGAYVRSEAEKTVAAVAKKIEDQNRQADMVLMALPKVVETQKRCSLLRVLGRIGNDNALAALRAVLNSDDANEKDTAIRALSIWPNPKPINDLLTTAKTSENNIHRILALRGYIRMIGLTLDTRLKTQEQGLESEVLSLESAVKMYKQAMEVSENVPEKRMVLSGLANVYSPTALEMAASYLQDTALQQEAEIAVVNIAENIYTDHPQQTKDVLNRIIQTSKNESLRQKAQKIVKTIDDKP